MEFLLSSLFINKANEESVKKSIIERHLLPFKKMRNKN